MFSCRLSVVGLQKIESIVYSNTKNNNTIIHYTVKKMRSQYNSQVEEIKKIAMKDCLQHINLNGTLSFDFGFDNIQVQINRQMD